MKVLFLLKRRSYCGNSYGLKVSCELVAKALKDYHVHSKIVTIVDSNEIDREVHNFKPDFCFLEAIYAPPYKVREVIRLHPNTHFNVRIHSKVEFLAQESMAFNWLAEYKEIAKYYSNFSISANNLDFIHEMNNALGYRMDYTPNIYPIEGKYKTDTNPIGSILSVGAFGALRILKNHLQMAVGAIKVADDLGLKLRFHINDSSTIEKEGNSIKKNLISLFADTRHDLVMNNWEHHHDFTNLVKRMDLGLQISMSESFNLTAADFIAHGIPVVGSPEITFLSSLYQARPTDFEDIVNKIKFALKYKTWGIHLLNEIKLRNHNKVATQEWVKYLFY